MAKDGHKIYIEIKQSRETKKTKTLNEGTFKSCNFKIQRSKYKTVSCIEKK